MGLFDSFKKKEEKIPAFAIELDKVLFPGGDEEKRELLSELKSLLNNQYDDTIICDALVYMTSLFHISQDKSADRVVRRGALKRSNNNLTEVDAMIIYKFVVRQQYKKIIPNNDEIGFMAFYKALGNNDDGATTDIIPGAYGEYGLCNTNPIPINGILANEVYLRSLRLISGEAFTWERLGSTGAENIDSPIDIYSITTENGKHLCDLYISPYQNTISTKAPKGFYIKH